MAPAFTTAEWLQVARLLRQAEAANYDLGLPTRAHEARALRQRILDSTTSEPSKLQPNGQAYRDTLVSERLNLRKA